MIYSSRDALRWCEQIIAAAIIFQTLEMFQLRATFGKRGVWRWQTIRREFVIFPAASHWIFDCLLDYPNFLWVLAARLLAAAGVLLTAAMPLYSVFLFVLFLSTLLVAVRWRGTFNGGSDYMTLIITLSLWIAACFESHAWVSEACLWYIALQSCSSYFVAGLAKIKHRDWRTGKALARFMSIPTYNCPAAIQTVFRQSLSSSIVSWGIILFECSFPLNFVHPSFSLVFIGCAFLFQLANVYVFGLNRFLFAWSASYPALYWCSHGV